MHQCHVIFYVLCWWFYYFLTMLVFVGNQTPSVSWIKDDKHMGLKLRHFKVFPYLFPFPFQGSLLIEVLLLNVNECVYADCYCCRMAPERWLLFDSDVGRYPLSVSCGQLMHASLFIGLFIGNNDYIVSVMIVYENIIFLIFFFGILLKFICFFLGVCP